MLLFLLPHYLIKQAIWEDLGSWLYDFLFVY